MLASRALCVTTGSAASTIDRIHHARRRDGELAVPIRHEGRVLEDRLLAAAARSFQKDLRVRVVGHDGPPTTLDRGRAEGELVGDRHDLVRDDDGHAEGLGDLLCRRASMSSRALFKLRLCIARLCDSHALTCVAMVFLTPLRRSIARLKVRARVRGKSPEG
jgi:hypothetical protein